MNEVLHHHHHCLHGLFSCGIVYIRICMHSVYDWMSLWILCKIIIKIKEIKCKYEIEMGNRKRRDRRGILSEEVNFQSISVDTIFVWSWAASSLSFPTSPPHRHPIPSSNRSLLETGSSWWLWEYACACEHVTDVLSWLLWTWN